MVSIVINVHDESAEGHAPLINNAVIVCGPSLMIPILVSKYFHDTGQIATLISQLPA